MTDVDGLNDTQVVEILKTAKTFALIGASANPLRPSYGVMEFLIASGYQVHPVNPGHAGQMIQGRTVYATLADVPSPVDVVDVFRNSDAAAAVVIDVIALKEPLSIKVVWMQVGVINEQAAQHARDAGITVVMDRCPKIEAARLRKSDI
ncbi:MAG: CoA-binding protein [Hyphomicrobium sp.]|nr:MAG: CoA-binding protein [Hyphomicrobium sp.]PPD00066.1 MAG: CoA-binding protein [Hyphomicrobium sp.]